MKVIALSSCLQNPVLYTCVDASLFTTATILACLRGDIVADGLIKKIYSLLTFEKYCSCFPQISEAFMAVD